MTANRKLRRLYRAAYTYLKDKIGQEALERKLDHYRGEYKAENMQDVFWHMLNSLKNKSSMPQTIGDIDPLSPHVFGFDPWQTHDFYQDDWKKLFKTIKAHHTPPGPMNIKRENSYWVIFCKGVLSGAQFLCQFSSFDEFDQFVRSFGSPDIALYALPILIDQEVYGMADALGADWLKEMGYQDYCKPDRHTIAILYETGCAPSADNYTIFRTMVKMGRVNHEPPAVIDRLLWLIGSGKFVGENEKITRQRAAFISEVTATLN